MIIQGAVYQRLFNDMADPGGFGRVAQLGSDPVGDENDGQIATARFEIRDDGKAVDAGGHMLDNSALAACQKRVGFEIVAGAANVHDKPLRLEGELERIPQCRIPVNDENGLLPPGHRQYSRRPRVGPSASI
ncbi:hypothetical protein [Methylovirgula sp. 4M-Z18]|uniref:hypothetical protein n=1 Tax=Methylovirgula sp. 4M-Z18 TaxID=2293567 RepID=UPI001FE15306|nr:hypothetical protein [Methylovirgula sp. 4M-Z18]